MYNPNQPDTVFSVEHPSGIKTTLLLVPSASDLRDHYILSTRFDDEVFLEGGDPRAIIADALVDVAEAIRRYKPLITKGLLNG